MNKEIGLWQFVRERLKHDQGVMLLVVADSSGSSPGRAGYKMAVANDGELCGSIGGGVMEVELVERARVKSKTAKGKNKAEVIEQVHRKNVPNSSGMICSGRQSVLEICLTADDTIAAQEIVNALENNSPLNLMINQQGLQAKPVQTDIVSITFEKHSESEFTYTEKLGAKSELYIIGGGHCALALSELASKLGFRISIFDDRPELNTLEKNEFADSVTVIDSYENIAAHIPVGDDAYVVVMTLGYRSDAVVIRRLIDHELKYFGVLGSKAKMATLMKDLRDEGFDADKLAHIRTPIGILINSHSPEEIAVSIAAELISVRNS